LPHADDEAHYRVTGLQVRSLPISLETVLEHELSILPDTVATSVTADSASKRI
jgi:hypothetical protein